MKYFSALSVVLLAHFALIKAIDTLSTYAGVQTSTGSYFGDGGPATSAKFNNPSFIWVNTNGDAFVTDSYSDRLRKIDSSGIITLYAGKGSGSFAGDGSPATSTGIAAVSSSVGDTAGNIYVCAVINVYKVSGTTNQVFKFGGGGLLGYSGSNTDEGAPATSMAMDTVKTACIDTVGDVYIFDATYHKIKKISASTGLVHTIAGSYRTGSYPENTATDGDGGPATSAALVSPYQGSFIGLDLYITGPSASSVRKISLTTGIISCIAGGTGVTGYTGEGGPATAARLRDSTAYMTTDGVGTVYVTYGTYHHIREIDITAGIINSFAGQDNSLGYQGDGGAATAGLLYRPIGVAYHDGHVYIGDSFNNVFRAVLLTTNPTFTSTAPSFAPTLDPSTLPTVVPSQAPSLCPSTSPTRTPSAAPSLNPSLVPTAAPSFLPTLSPSSVPTMGPTLEPSMRPSVAPSLGPSVVPTVGPSQAPTVGPSLDPTAGPSIAPSECPSVAPSVAPSLDPSVIPSLSPSVNPSIAPSFRPNAALPSRKPSCSPTMRPTRTVLTLAPTVAAEVTISFDSTLTLRNVTSSGTSGGRRLTSSSNGRVVLDATAQTAVEEAVAETLSLDESQVTFVSQKLISTETRPSGIRYYVVRATVNVQSSTTRGDATTVYSSMVSVLNDAVDTSMFSATLRDVSAELHSRSTMYVGDVNVTVKAYTVLHDELSDDEDSSGVRMKMRAWATSILVLGSAIVCGVIIWYCVKARRSQSAEEGGVQSSCTNNFETAGYHDVAVNEM